ncbi:class I adenylate-forming enzyme family protein [Anaerocolumna xylanovorans]|uniref:Fatty-acyl-CoA synthase n=1 Tax=Anaerocolumna xylanovorans DSM 12503 TaxID=1121345 RepID=A0A1M7YL33_9FIRM|nr:class I adenylate-forming enzyme family protein [Anaerocolumna xylanovorans]SHO53319.1 fatty-acyl-CoA synthase [Anaerocolumna xylanovorans DSM 12503]
MIKGSTLWDDSITQDMESTVFNGIQVLSYTDMPSSLYHALRLSADRYPDKILFCDNWERSYSYREFLAMTDKMAWWLKNNLQVTKGKHVGLLLHNSIEFCTAFFAVVKLGAIAVPFPTKYKETEAAHLIMKADLDVLIFSETFKGWMKPYEEAGIRLLESENEEAGFGFRHLLRSGFYGEESVGEGNLSDEVIIMFTSGTTSRSKGVVLRNYNVMNAVAIYHRILGITAQDKTIIPVPVYHITGMVALLGLFVFTGGTVYLYKRYDAVRILECIRQNGITFMHGAPTVYSLMLEHKEEYPMLTSLRILACGGSYMPTEKLRELHKWLPQAKIQVVYGMTETSSPAVIFPGDAPTSIFAGAAGKPVPGLELKILDEEGNEKGYLETGEVWIRGNVVTGGYYKMDTSLIDSEHWLNTGDMGYCNEESYVFIVDRKKDMINRGGEKIWCTDVEEELLKLPFLKDAAVVGIKDSLYGESAAAAVVIPKGQKVNAEDIRKALEPKMAKFKIPVKYLFLDEIPKTAGMKTNKKIIREMFERNPI